MTRRLSNPVLLLLAGLLAAGCNSLNPKNEPAVPLTPASEVTVPASMRVQNYPAAKPVNAAAIYGSQDPAAQSQPASSKQIKVVSLSDQAAQVQASPASTSQPASQAVIRPSRPVSVLPIGTSEVIAAAVLQVNDKYITVDDVLKSCSPQLAELPRKLSPQMFRTSASRIVREQVQRRAVDELVLAEAEKYLNEDQKKVIEDEMKDTLRDLVAHADGSQKKLEAELLREGKTLEDALKEQRRKLKIQAFLQTKFRPSIYVTRSMLWEYYASHQKDYAQPRRVQMQILAVPFSAFLTAGQGASEVELKAAKDKAMAEIRSAQKALASGEEFSAVVRKYGHGGRPGSDGVWPLITEGSFRETRIENAALAQKANSTSDVIETDDSFYIVKTLKIESGRSVSFEQAQDEILPRLQENQYRKLTNAYFDELMKKATVTGSDKFIEVTVERAAQRYYSN